MKKITKRMVKYMVLINLIIIILAFVLTRLILPRIYNNNEYRELEKTSRYAVEAIEKNESINFSNISVALIINDKVQILSGGKGQGRNIDFASLKEKQIYTAKNKHTYITYKKSTEYGDLVVYKSYEGIEQLITSVDIMMICICIFLLICSILLAIFLGNKFTKPIITLQNRAKNIAKGIYNTDYNIRTKDEIEVLAESINDMARDLEIKDNMQKEFIANVSHDLKTPLSIIRANSEVIKDGLVSGEQVVEFSENIISEVDRLNELVGEILVLTKIKDNNKILKLRSCLLKDFINDSYNKLNNRNILKNNTNGNYDTSNKDMDYRKLDFQLSILVKNIEDLTIEIDLIYLFRVLCNLFDNAVIHSESEKIILIVEEVNEGIKVGIKDYGKGIRSEDINFIWDRYYKGNESGGMGLGLAISREIILAHGFYHGVESYLNKGTEFYFVIPKELIK